MTDLDDFRLDRYPEPTPDERDGFAITDDDLAEWALRKLAAYRSEIARIQARAKDEIETVKMWEHDRTKSLFGHVAFMESALIDYRRRLELTDPKLPQTYHLTAGAITRRKGSRHIVIHDPEAFEEWAWVNKRDALKVVARVSNLTEGTWTVDEELAVIVNPETGETVPGVRVERDPDQYGTRLTKEDSGE
jgi:phage host-nuclease inhibitor protein Gam